MEHPSPDGNRYSNLQIPDIRIRIILSRKFYHRLKRDFHYHSKTHS